MKLAGENSEAIERSNCSNSPRRSPAAIHVEVNDVFRSRPKMRRLERQRIGRNRFTVTAQTGESEDTKARSHALQGFASREKHSKLRVASDERWHCRSD